MAKTNTRGIRINDEIQRETAEIIRGELKDPRIGKLCSVVKVDTTKDLKYCKIFISVLGTEEEKKEVFKGLDSANGYIRKLLAERINLRATPELKFIPDDSIEYAAKMMKLINEVNNEPK